jgi:hypothetical protein
VSAWLLRLGRLRRLCAHKRMHRDGAAVMCAGRSVHAHALHAHCTQQWLLQTRASPPLRHQLSAELTYPQSSAALAQSSSCGRPL